MNYSLSLKVIAAVALLAVACLLVLQKTDREFINLGPSDGIEHSLVLETNHTYQQTFIATRKTISRLGIFLKPTRVEIPVEAIEINLLRGSDVIARGTISSAFIDDGFTQVRFDSPIPTTLGEKLAFKISVPSALSGTFRTQQRTHDESFSRTDAAFYVDGKQQTELLAYQLYHDYQPVFVMHVGILLGLVGLYLIGGKYLRGTTRDILFAGVVFVLAALPGWLLNESMLLLALTVSVAWLSMLRLLTSAGLPYVAAITGANAFAFSTWFPLHFVAGREGLMALAALPVPLLYIARLQSKRAKVVTLFLCALVVMGFFSTYTPSTYFAPAQPRDIFLDPIQAPTTLKTSLKMLSSAVPWDHYGSYLGVPLLLAAIVGVAWRGRQQLPFLLLGLISAAVALVPAVHNTVYRVFGLPGSYAVILVTTVASIFAAYGLAGLHVYLKKDVVTDRLILALATLALLDLLYVFSATIEYSAL